MSAAEIYSALGGASGGTAIVMLALFITGRVYSKDSYDEMKAQRDDMRAQRDEWKRTADTERARAEVVVPAALVVRDMVSGIQAAARRELE